MIIFGSKKWLNQMTCLWTMESFLIVGFIKLLITWIVVSSDYYSFSYIPRWIQKMLPYIYMSLTNQMHNMYFRYTFSSNHNIHKSSAGHCLWASDPLIERF